MHDDVWLAVGRHHRMGLFTRTPKAHPYDTSSPDEVLALAARTDAEAFAILYERYREPIFAFVQARLGNAADAEDITSQVFTRAYAAMPRYREGSFRGWIHRIARNVIVDHYRQTAGTVPLEPEWHQDAYAHPASAHFDRIDIRATIDSEIARLPSTQRQVMTLRLQGRSTAQIAADLGMTVGAVKSAQHRAFCTLEQRFGRLL